MKTQLDEIEAGEVALVLCATVFNDDFIGGFAKVVSNVPIFPCEHEDSAIINFPLLHYHADYRFWSDELLDKFHLLDCPFDRATRIQRSDCILEVYEIEMVCIREPEFISRDVHFLPKLQEAYRGQKAKCGLCPHKGCKIFRENGVLTCPGHGLQFDDSGTVI